MPVQTPAQEQITSESYLVYLQLVVEMVDLPVRTYESVSDVRREAAGFILATETAAGIHHYHCRQVVLATGDMAFARLLHIPDEELPHVSHRFREPHE